MWSSLKGGEQFRCELRSFVGNGFGFCRQAIDVANLR